MRVNNTNSQAVQGSESTDQAEKAAKSRKAVESELANKKTESVSSNISEQAKERAKAKDVAMGAPDARADKIAELKKRIANKQYNVAPEDVADKMIKEHLDTRHLG